MSRRAAIALAVLCVAQFVEVLGVTVAVVALPSIARDLGAGAATVQWAVTAYALTFGGLLLAGGRAADRLGRRRVFVAGVLGFAAASLACGLAASAPALIAARAVQGAAAAVVVPAALSLLTATFGADPALRTRALAVWTAAAAGGGASGFLLGGVVTGVLGWRWVFLCNVPVALAAAAIAPRVLDEARAGARRTRVVDALRRRGVVRGAAVSFTLTATTSSAAVLVTAHLQEVLGRSPAATGLVFVAFSVAAALGSLLGPRLVARIGRDGTITLGLGVVAAGIALLVLSGTDDGVATIAIGLAVSGAGLGWAAVAATETGMAGADDAEQGVAAGVLNTATQLGTAIGVAVIGTLAAWRTGSIGGPRDAALVDGFHLGWLVAAGLAAAAALVAMTTGASCPGVRQRSRA
jgi:MFS family permease